jgi:hypothetical protein
MNTNAGWFPDPSDPKIEAYFDGKRWTGEKRVKTKNSSQVDKSEAFSISLPIRPDFFNKKRVLIGVGVLLLTIAVAAFANFLSEEAAKKDRVQAAAERLEQEAAELAAEVKRIQDERADYSWVPSGFTKFSMNNNMAWKKIGYDAADCYSTCFGMEVVSRDYCSSISIEASILRNDVILDTASDYASEIPAGTRTVMRIASSAASSWNASFTKAECT